MIENNFAELEFINSIVVEIKQYTLCLSVQFWEVDSVPFLKRSPVKVSFTNFSPASTECMENANLYMSWRTFRMRPSILESYSLET
jgi:hypothetical protein